MKKNIHSFGRFFRYEHELRSLAWSSDAQSVFKDLDGKTLLPYGKGRSYGDSCLNDGQILLDMSLLNKVVFFDKDSGVITCEAGFTIGSLIELVSPFGWFVPVSPGTKHVTIAGAVANDVHGKNHHVRGSFGNHVVSIKILRSDGEIKTIGPEEPLFFATIGGIGLTGVILEVTLQLIKASSWFDTENIKFSKLEEFYRLSDESERDWEYTVAWIDSTAAGSELGRGVFMRGNHATDPSLPLKSPKPLAAVPVNAPNFLLNTYSVKAFNYAYFNRQLSEQVSSIVHYDSYLYPLDVLDGWNKLYGRRGFFQYQFVIPESEKDVMKDILKVISSSGQGSFLTVLKKFGSSEPVGLMSFPLANGYMLALDFANEGEKTDNLFERLDQMVASAGGRLYPAKDSKMSAKDFSAFYPKLEEFKTYVDPAMSSSFWRRVTGGS